MKLFDELMKSDDEGIRRETVTVFGRELKLRSLSAEEFITYTEENAKPENKRVAGVRLLVASIEDDEEQRIEEGQQPALVRRLLKKDFRELQRVTRVARVLNGLATQEESKNDSGEAKTIASPSA